MELVDGRVVRDASRDWRQAVCRIVMVPAGVKAGVVIGCMKKLIGSPTSSKLDRGAPYREQEGFFSNFVQGWLKSKQRSRSDRV